MKIIAGEYEGKRAIAAWGKISIQVSLFKFIRIQDQIVKYEIIDEQKQKSLKSAIAVSYTHLTLPTKRIV